MTTLESLLSKISGGKQLEVITSFTGSVAACDNVASALSGLTRHEMNYLFWAFSLGGKAFHVRDMLTSEATKFIKSDELNVSDVQKADVVQLVTKGLRSTFTKYCRACGGTGNNDRADVCKICFGSGRVDISQRKIAKELQIAWSSYYRNKSIKKLIDHLFAFCAQTEGNITKHIAQSDKKEITN